MTWMLTRNIFLMLILGFSSAAVAQKRNQPFSLEVQGFAKDMEHIQLKGEYEMAKNTSYCRGIRIPAPSGEWSCETIGTGVKKCVRSYACRMVTRDYNVQAVTASLVAQMKKFPALTTKFKVTFVDRPKNKLDRAVVEKITSPGDLGDPSGLRLSADEIEALRDDRINEEALRALKEDLKEQREQALAKEEELRKAARQRNKGSQQTSAPRAVLAPAIKENRGELNMSDEAELQALYEEEFIEDRKSNSDTSTYFQEEGQKASGPKNQSSFKPLSFSASVLQSSDDVGNSLSTFDLGWTPEYTFADSKWGVRGQVSAHFFKLPSAESEDAKEEENFLVLDLAALVTYEMGRVYVEAGLGMQKWMDVAGESYSALHLGLGYRFKEQQLLILDRIFLGYNKVSSEMNNVDLRFGVGASF